MDSIVLGALSLPPFPLVRSPGAFRRYKRSRIRNAGLSTVELVPSQPQTAKEQAPLASPIGTKSQPWSPESVAKSTDSSDETISFLLLAPQGAL